MLGESKYMKELGCILCLMVMVLFSSGTSAQHTTSIRKLQNISSGALWFDYNKHREVSKFPTVVFESGALSHSTYWNPVIDSVANFANTVRYDRAGLGRSTPSVDSTRTSVQVASELNELLDSLGVEQQIVLVCHSAGGFYGRTFAYLFPKRVQALILIESPCTKWEKRLRSCLTQQQNQDRDSVLRINRSRLTSFERKEYQAAEQNRTFLDRLPQSNVPLHVIYGSNHNWPVGYNRGKLDRSWKECQMELLEISTKSSLKVVPNAGHHIFRQFDLPRFIEEIILK